MYYASFGLIALVLDFIINAEVLKNYSAKDSEEVMRRYRHFLLSVMVYYVSDILWGFLYERRFITLVYVDTVIYFAAMVISVLLWTRYVVAYLKRITVRWFICLGQTGFKMT